MTKDREHQPPQQCPSCSGTSLETEEARLPSKWRAASHLVQLYVCTGCSFVQTFYVKQSRVTGS